MKQIQVMIVDDHPVVREGLKALLSRSELVRIAQEATDGLDCLAKLKLNVIDVVLLDWMMPRLDGLETCRRIQSEFPNTKVLMLTNHLDDGTVKHAIQAGAVGYLLKDVTFDDLESAIVNVSTGTRVLHEEARDNLAQGASSAMTLIDTLTQRERDVLTLISRGQSNKEIGRTLGLTEGTVKGYVSTILAKTNTADRTQAALFAVKVGLK